jgi:hypothetical protein
MINHLGDVQDSSLYFGLKMTAEGQAYSLHSDFSPDIEVTLYGA